MYFSDSAAKSILFAFIDPVPGIQKKKIIAFGVSVHLCARMGLYNLRTGTSEVNPDTKTLKKKNIETKIL